MMINRRASYDLSRRWCLGLLMIIQSIYDTLFICLYLRIAFGFSLWFGFVHAKLYSLQWVSKALGFPFLYSVVLVLNYKPCTYILPPVFSIRYSGF